MVGGEDLKKAEARAMEGGEDLKKADARAMEGAEDLKKAEARAMEGAEDLEKAEARAMERAEDLEKTEGIVNLVASMLKKSKEEAQPAGAGPRRMKLVMRRVSHTLIRTIQELPRQPFPEFSEEELAVMPEGTRARHARIKASHKVYLDFEAHLVHEYSTKGYAEIPEWVDDDEEVQN